MRELNRNKRKIYYALLIGEEKIYDEYGNETSETVPVYGEKTELMCNVSATSGVDEVSAFGNFADYSRTIAVADVNCPLEENTALWFGVEPQTESYNYIVVRKADSKNGVLYALQKVSVGQ